MLSARAAWVRCVSIVVASCRMCLAAGLCLAGGLCLATGIALGQAESDSLSRYEASWAATESGAQSFDEQARRREANRARREIERAERARRKLQLFFSRGMTEGADGSAVRTIIQSSGHSSGVRVALSAKVPSIPASEFAVASLRSLAVDVGGQILTPPAGLYSTRSDDPLTLARGQFETRWAAAVDVAAAGEPMSREELAELRQSLDDYIATAEASLPDLDFSSQFAARKYLRAVRLAVTQLARPSTRGQVVSSPAGAAAVHSAAVHSAAVHSAAHSTVAFPGGTVADLVEHAISRRLSFRRGGQVSEQLAPLAESLLAQLDQEVAESESTLARTRQESPAKDAALKKRVATRPTPRPTITGGGTGYTTRRGRSTWWTWTVTRPITTRIVTIPAGR